MQEQIQKAKSLLESMGYDASFANEETLISLAETYGWTPTVTEATEYQDTDELGNPVVDGEGNPVMRSITTEVPNRTPILVYITQGTVREWKDRVQKHLWLKEAKEAKHRSITRARELFGN